MTITSASATPKPVLSTTALLRAIAVEIRQVADDCRTLEALVIEIIANAPDGRQLNRLQAFDLIIQRLTGVGTVVESLADEAPIAWIEADRILSEVSLSALVSRLAGQAGAAPTRPPGDAEIW